MLNHTRKLLLLGALVALTLNACQTAPPSPSPSPTPPDRVGALIAKAHAARASEDHESEALALREAVDLMGNSGDSARLEPTRADCVRAMVEAGGNTESFRLWSELETKDSARKEAAKMKERARKLMLQQAGELVDQVELDLKARRPQAALCTARASLELCREAQADPALLKRAETAVKTCVTALQPAATSHDGTSALPGGDTTPPGSP